MKALHILDYPISFGDCDPAGIVFYPNIYSWFDRTFHNWLQRYGGHSSICSTLDAIGLGVFEASARFRRPMCDGDLVTLTLAIEEWTAKTMRLRYESRVKGQLTAEGVEVRGMFRRDHAGTTAADIEPLRKLLETFNHER